MGDSKALSGTSDQRRIADWVCRREEQEAARFVRKACQATREALLDAGGQGHLRGQPKSPRQLRRRQAARQLEQRQRVAAGLVDDSVEDALVQRCRQDGFEQRPCVAMPQGFDVELGQPRERVARLARGEHQSDPLSQEAVGDECEGACRPTVQPLGVVDDSEKRPFLGGLGEQPQDCQSDEKRIGGCPGGQAEGDAERVALRLREPFHELREG